MIKLIELFKAFNKSEFSNDCLEAINSGENFDYKATDLIPIEQVLSIYSIRSRLNKARGSKIEGYDLLLEELKKSNLKNIKIHLIQTTTNNFVVFTDSEEITLLGILRITKKS